MGGRADPAAWGIPGSYRDALERRHVIPIRSRMAVLEAMDLPTGLEPGGSGPVMLVHPGQRADARGELTLEDGTALGAVDALPPDLPIGYHRLDERPLLVAPRRSYLPRALRAWGWVARTSWRSARRWESRRSPARPERSDAPECGPRPSRVRP